MVYDTIYNDQKMYVIIPFKHTHMRNSLPHAIIIRCTQWARVCMTNLVWFRSSNDPSQVLMWEFNGFWLCHFPWYRKQLPAALIIEKAHNSSLSLPHWPSLPPSHQFKRHLTFCFNYPGHFLQWHWAQKWCCGHCAALELNLD